MQAFKIGDKYYEIVEDDPRFKNIRGNLIAGLVLADPVDLAKRAGASVEQLIKQGDIKTVNPNSLTFSVDGGGHTVINRLGDLGSIVVPQGTTPQTLGATSLPLSRESELDAARGSGQSTQPRTYEQQQAALNATIPAGTAGAIQQQGIEAGTIDPRTGRPFGQPEPTGAGASGQSVGQSTSGYPPINSHPASQLTKEEYASRAGVSVDRVQGTPGNYVIGPEPTAVAQPFQSGGQSFVQPPAPGGTAGALELQRQGYSDVGTNASPGANSGVSGASTGASVVEEVLKKLYDSGYKINPNAQIGATSLDELLVIAGKEIDPYYQTQLKLVSDDLKRSLGYSAEQIAQGERDLETKYGRSLRDVGESAAESGFALSGKRQLQERELASDTQRAIEQGRRQLQFSAGNAVGKFARQFGGMSGFQLPGATLTQAPRVLAGQSSFDRSGQQSPFYELSGDLYDNLVGSEEFNRRAAIRSRASELEGAQNLQSSLPLRSLNV